MLELLTMENIDTEQNLKAISLSKHYQKAFDLCAGMLNLDKKFILAFYPFLVIQLFLHLSSTPFDQSTLIYALVASKIFSLLFLYLVARRWIEKLKMTKSTFSTNNLLLFFAFAFVQTCLLYLPILAQVSTASATLKSLFIFLLIPSIYLILKYYFYFVAIVAGVKSPAEVISFAQYFTLKDPLIGLKPIICGLGITTILQGIVSIPAPDGRSLILVALSLGFSGLFWVLHTYMAVAIALIFMNDSQWRQLDLDPYREGRFATIAINSPSWIKPIIEPKNAIKMLIIGGLISIGNILTAQSMKPAPEITLVSNQYKEQQIELTLELQDHDYKFNGFTPLGFFIAGEQRKTLSSNPEKILINNQEWSLTKPLPRESGKIEVKLYLKSELSHEELSKLKDVYLWYNFYKVMPLKF